MSAEAAYRIELTEVPDRTQQKAGSVMMRSRVSVPVFVQPAPQTVVAPALPPAPGTEEGRPVEFGDYFAERIGMMYADSEH